MQKKPNRLTNKELKALLYVLEGATTGETASTGFLDNLPSWQRALRSAYKKLERKMDKRPEPAKRKD